MISRALTMLAVIACAQSLPAEDDVIYKSSQEIRQQIGKTIKVEGVVEYNSKIPFLCEDKKDLPPIGAIEHIPEKLDKKLVVIECVPELKPGVNSSGGLPSQGIQGEHIEFKKLKVLKVSEPVEYKRQRQSVQQQRRATNDK